MACNSRGLPAQAQAQVQPGFALADFVAERYGPEYLELLEGEHVSVYVCRDEDKGWAFGERLRDNTRGWFPAAYWKAYPSPSSPPHLGHSNLESRGGFGGGIFAEAESQIGGGRNVYSRFHMLQVRHVLQKSLQSAPPDPQCIEIRGPLTAHLDLLGIEMRGQRPRQTAEEGETHTGRQQERKSHPLEDALPKLVEVAGGKVKIRNLAAAGLALGVMSGGHAQVCQDIIFVVQSRPDIFGPVPEVPVAEVSNTYITLRTSPGEELLDPNQPQPMA